MAGVCIRGGCGCMYLKIISTLKLLMLQNIIDFYFVSGELSKILASWKHRCVRKKYICFTSGKYNVSVKSKFFITTISRLRSFYVSSAVAITKVYSIPTFKKWRFFYQTRTVDALQLWDQPEYIIDWLCSQTDSVCGPVTCSWWVANSFRFEGVQSILDNIVRLPPRLYVQEHWKWK